MSSRKNWNESEIVQAIDLYIRTPFGCIHSRNPDIILLSERLGRTPSSIALKLSNLAAIDDSIPQKGMSKYSKLDRKVWEAFFASLKTQTINFPIEVDVLENEFSAGKQASYSVSPTRGNDVVRIGTARQGQQYFRKIVLASYDNKCAITGIEQPELLIAGHIRKWSQDQENRMNPYNGICLNRLHDRAFEANLMAIEDDGKILYSKQLGSTTIEKMRNMNDSGYFSFPKKFSPNLDFLREHREAFLD